MRTCQATIYAAIRDFRESHAYGPSLRELATACGISFQAVHQHVQAMQRAGLVTHQASVARSLDIIQVAETNESGKVQASVEVGT